MMDKINEFVFILLTSHNIIHMYENNESFYKIFHSLYQRIFLC